MSSYLKFASSEWPFIGLRPFQYGDHEYFFGREQELNVLDPQITQKRFVAIVGASGSGKSSLISAGLRPRFEKIRDHPWNWIEMHPADAPVRRLAVALADLTGETSGLLQAWADRFERVLTKSSFGIGEALALIPALRESEGSRVLLLVDQFEELFRFAKLRSEGSLDPATFAERRDEATAFVRLLLAAHSSDVPIHVVVTMRSDFIGDCARFHGLPEAVSRSQFLVPGMARDQREDVIRKPIQRAGGQVDPQLVQHALIATNEDPDQLPILQHVLMRCWERASHHTSQKPGQHPHLTIDDYRTVGGVEQALSLHANEILDALIRHSDSPAIGPQLATKRLFQALTETDQEGRSVRRPQRFCDLVQYVRPGTAIEQVAKEATCTVVRRFARSDCSFLRVIPPTETNDTSDIDTDSNMGIADNSIIDIGHEALIRRWDKLNAEGEENWIREEQEDAEQYRGLLRYVDSGSAIPLKDLTRVEDWWSSRKPNGFWALRYTRHNADNFEKVRELRARSRSEADAAIEEHQRYASQLIGTMASAIQNPKRYNGAADSLAMALTNKGPDLPNVAEYVEALYNGLAHLHERRRIETPVGVAKQIFALSFSPAGKLLAAAVPNNLLFYDADTGEHVHSERIPGGWVMSLRWSPDGKRIYVGTSPIGLILAPCSVEKLRKYFTDSRVDKWDISINIGSEELPAGAAAWSYDSKWIITAGWQRQASLWNASSGEFKRVLYDDRLEGNPLDNLFSDLAASADGKRIAFGATSGKIHIFNTRSSVRDGLSLRLEKSLDLEGNSNSLPYSLVFDPQNHGRLFATYMASPNIALWKIDENVPPTLYVDAESGPIWRIACDPESKFVASATNDTAVRLWTLPDSDSAIQLRGHLSSLFAVDISPKNRNVASASFDGTIRLWTKDSPLSARLLSDSTFMPAPNKFNVQNSHISVIANGGRHYWGTLPQEFGEPSAAAVSASGAGIAVVPRSGQPVLLVNLTDYLAPVSTFLSGVKAEWTSVAFIENDTRIAASTKEGKIFAWPFYSDVRSLEQLAKEHLPLVRDKNGLEKRLEVPGFLLRR